MTGTSIIYGWDFHHLLKLPLLPGIVVRKCGHQSEEELARFLGKKGTQFSSTLRVWRGLYTWNILLYICIRYHINIILLRLYMIISSVLLYVMQSYLHVFEYYIIHII